MGRGLNKMKTIHKICGEVVTPRKCTTNTPVLVELVYAEYGKPLKELNGEDLLYGTEKIPKLLSVIRAVQKKKKEVAKEFYKLEKEVFDDLNNL